MAIEKPINIKVFYSWQSQTDETLNRHFIKQCLEKAFLRISELNNINFEIIDSISNVAGTPPVADKIFELIKESDIFIGDLSIVNYKGFSKIKKEILKLLGALEDRPTFNANVLIEFTHALSQLGNKKILAVMNSDFGDPFENPETITFDLRHLNFPIQFKHKGNSKEVTEEKLIEQLSEKLRLIVDEVLKDRKSKYHPFRIWKDWENITPTKSLFLESPKFIELKSSMVEVLGASNRTTRFIGLSGLGKTRSLLEIFRPGDDQESISLSSRVLYIDFNENANLNWSTYFININKSSTHHILIIDNCPLDLHRQVHQFSQQPDNKIIFISISSDPEEIYGNQISEVNYIDINTKDCEDVVNQILANDFNGLNDQQLETIRKFSQGNTLMAVLLAESVKGGEQYIGRLEDQEILNKLLGNHGKDTTKRAILRSFAIFNTIGVEDAQEEQLRIVATDVDITPIGGIDQEKLTRFLEIKDQLSKRQIFEKSGRFISMRPSPLAMMLAQEWLLYCDETRLGRVIIKLPNLPHPHNQQLTKAFGEQFRLLTFDDRAMEIVEKLLGENGPFRKAEVLNSELGSRFFRYFVEVNPEAVANVMHNLLESLTISELKALKQSRRNLVFVAEKLCFDKRTFQKGAKLLLKLSIAENETWANNASGQFVQLFRVFLPGTEADLNQRFQLLQWIINHDTEEFYQILFKCYEQAFKVTGISRMGGAEIQGSKRLKDYWPNQTDLKIYWDNILTHLLNLVNQQPKYLNEIVRIIESSVRQIAHAGLIKLVVPLLNQIADIKNYDWDSIVEILNSTIKWEKLERKDIEHIEPILIKLRKTDFVSRFKFSGTNYYEVQERSNRMDAEIQAMDNFASEYVKEYFDNFKIIKALNEVNRQFTYYFGKAVFQIIKSDDHMVIKFLDNLIRSINELSVGYFQPQIALGFLADNGVKDFKEYFYFRLNTIPEKRKYLFNFISNDKGGKAYFYLLYDMIIKNEVKVSNFEQFEFSEAIRNLSEIELREFVDVLFSFGNESFPVVLGILYETNNSKFPFDVTDLQKKCIEEIGLVEYNTAPFPAYKFFDVISLILQEREEIDFAKFVNKMFIDKLTTDHLFHLDYEVKSIYEILLDKYFNVVWPEISKVLIEANYLHFIGLRDILVSSSIGFSRNSANSLFSNSDRNEIIIKWCRENKDGVGRLAELVPTKSPPEFNEGKWHPFAKLLLDNFGSDKKVLYAFDMNLGSYSWSGSLVPLLQSNIELFEEIENHPIENVRNWANSNIRELKKRIKEESIRDEERFIHY